MRYTTLVLATAASTVYAEASAYARCGGIGWTGVTTCVSGYECQYQNDYYYQCVAGSATSSAGTLVTKVTTPAATSSQALVTSTAVVAFSSAVSSSAAVASPSAISPTSVSSVSTSSTVVAYTAVVSTSSTSTAMASTTSAASSTVAETYTAASSAASSTSTGKIKYAGINISGFDFGCGTDGTCTTSSMDDPSTTGTDQMQHFVTDDGLNAFRLPIGWQYLVNSELGGTLDSTVFSAYDSLMTSCLDVAELCIIDIHNYARWNGNIVGQSDGTVTDAHFSSLWSQLATKYASKPKVAFGLMNEPHDLTDISTWATTIQTAVTAIRNSGATNNLILLPGNDWTHATSFVSDGSAAALANITNLDKSTTNLIFDVHAYLDSDGSGTSSSCSTNNVDAFTTLATWLRSNGRQAMLTETGGGASDSTCITNVCEQLQYLMDNSDVYLGWTGWAAGMFDSSYVLSETPTGSSGSYTDQELVTKCIAGIFNSA